MAQPHILVGVTGGVAAYKAAELVRVLQQHGAEVRVAMTRAAQEFIQPLTFSSITGHETITSMWAEGSEPATGLDDEGSIEHISVAQWAEAVVIAPATAHFLARLAHGLADDFLSTMLLATTAPVVVAPAMNVNMWNHPATQANLQILRDRGVSIVEPGSGYLACGMTGSGRLADVEAIAEAVLKAVSTPGREQDLLGETILITAGGTREPIDPVRFIGNRSSGKMGYALAEAARERGASVILVSAPTALTPPEGCTFVPFSSAAEMSAAVTQRLSLATVVIGAAAVADFRPVALSTEKLRREGKLVLELEPTEDILRTVARARRPGTLIIAFAAETTADVTRAREKMAAKQADAILLNDISGAETGFDSNRNAGLFITADSVLELPSMPKREMAERILDQLLTLRARLLVR
ncbi:MAG TPA: bifunctional phosphopantothenoylcysteine decarboxylase/phosphopantothenate--cysteine ligase CoaBC [Acidobacteriaceae bacterium]|jgi:phosphopantothenoylcysteine decarboxylase/phosphopantothenate--cysteine ligase|nr:bifunctional phosphopantothenoylcysteine decarboxylase/phosphopantothenate--cysteine ligase CoaBC [Acidobacteriaceae bacterium]